MTPQQLKNAILQLAIQGKLVEQRKEEGTGEELFKKIQEEKKKLIKEGKLKKQKTLPDITEEEIPFDIPETWKWVRLGDCISTNTGISYKKENLSKKSNIMVRVLRGGNIQDMDYIFKEDDIFISREFIKNNDLFLKKNSMITPAVTSLEHVGKMAMIEKDYSNVVVGGFVLTINPYFYNDYFSKYLLFVFSSYFFRENCRNICKKSGQAFYNLSREKFLSLIIPLPPLAEQKRIVEKIEQLLPLVDRYEKAWTRLEELNKKFPLNMQKAILQEAIQGKLVEQRKEDGTGEELYKEIQEEKKKLIEEGKLKKQKALPEITEDEIPFDIPETWKWVKLIDLVSILGDGIHGTPKYSASGDYYFINGNNLNDGKIELKDTTKKVDKQEWEKYKKNLDLHTILISINGTIGNIAFYNNEKIMLGKSACYFNVVLVELKNYLFFLLKSDYFLKYALHSATGATIKNVSLKAMSNFIIPLPPLAEQKRIVEKIEQLLPLCEKLE